MALQIEASFHPATWTLTYLVWDEDTLDAVVVDPVLDYDPATVGVTTDAVDALSKRMAELGLQLRATLETHAHADHITGAAELRSRYGSKVVAGAPIVEVQAFFGAVFDFPDFAPDGSDFDVLMQDGETLRAGSLAIEAIATPGHTPACTSYRIGDALFTGDTLFMPDFGTGRCDFPKGDASALYDSVQKLYALPDETRVFVGHDYQPGGRDLAWETTVGESKARNKHLRATTTREQFVQFRTERDAQLSAPRLILPSLHMNIRAGRLPEPEANGRRYMRLPINLFS